MARDRPSPYDEVAFFFVARGPSDAIRASERVSPAIVAWRGTGPRPTVKGGSLPPYCIETRRSLLPEKTTPSSQFNQFINAFGDFQKPIHFDTGKPLNGAAGPPNL